MDAILGMRNICRNLYHLRVHHDTERANKIRGGRLKKDMEKKKKGGADANQVQELNMAPWCVITYCRPRQDHARRPEPETAAP